MDSIMKISHELGIWDIPCACKRPEFKTGETLGRLWLPLVVELYDMTEEQENYLNQLNELYIARFGRDGYGGPFKKQIEIIMEKEIWNLDGCYITKVENNVITIEFDKTIVRY